MSDRDPTRSASGVDRKHSRVLPNRVRGSAPFEMTSLVSRTAMKRVSVTTISDPAATLPVGAKIHFNQSSFR